MFFKHILTLLILSVNVREKKQDEKSHLWVQRSDPYVMLVVGDRSVFTRETDINPAVRLRATVRRSQAWINGEGWASNL